MKLAESCVIEQHIDSLLKGVEPTKLGFGTPDAAALVVRIVRGWVNDMAWHPRKVRMLTSCYQLNCLGKRLRQSFSFYVLGSGEECLPSACCDLRGTMGSLRHEVLAPMRRWLDS